MNTKFILGTALLLSCQLQAAIRPIKSNNFNFEKINVTVAVIDTGVDINHKELKSFIWVNEGETGKDSLGRDKATNGIDDDDNGFVDDIHGWNFINNTNVMTDELGHGTHIAGIIKSEFKNYQSSTAPAAPRLRLMVLKYYDPKASDAENLQNSTKAIEYAVKMKAEIINYSGGGSSRSTQEFRAIEKAAQREILLVAAAGNNNTNTDFEKYYPANYPLQNIVSVAATDSQGELVSFSNYGDNSVDIAAPGKLIYSTLPKNSFGFMSGTSQATAFISGAAAGVLAQNKKTPPQQVLARLLTQSKFNKNLKGKVKFQMALLADAK